MTLIEGVGDEVVQFVGVVLVGAVAAAAWWSTNARPDRYRTVLVMRHRTHPVTVSIRTRSNLMLTGSQSNSSSSTTSTSTQPAPPETTSASTSSSVEASEAARHRVVPLQEMDSIVDADMAMLDHNRLHFYRRVEPSSNSQTVMESGSDDSDVADEVEVEVPASVEQMREMDNIVSAMEGEEPTPVQPSTEAIPEISKPNETASSSVITNENMSSAANVQTTESGRDTVDGNKILIKLKYLNDTLKEVEGNLDEKLKDFKSRHFSTELSSECRVRLIFNGRVLVDDCATLRACGLHHRAVVHCLVHPKRPTQPLAGAPTEAAAMDAPPERAWDLENILMTLVSVALTVVWFFRCEYSNMFTASASVALFGLTVFYSVAIFGLYLSDTFHFDRRPAPPVPNA